jgi:sugar phosphate permease
LADRYSARSTLVFGGLLSVLCTSVISPGMPVSFIIALQALNGLGQGFGWPAVNKLLSVWFPRGERAVILAWWSTSYALGGFLATALAEGLSTIGSVSIATGARLAIIVPSLILLLAIGYFYLRTKDSPEQVGLHAVNGPSADDAERTSFVRSWKPILHNREIQLLAAMYFFLKMTRYALLFWLPVYLVQTQHASNYAALSTSSLFELTGFIGALVAAYVSDRLLQGRRYPVGATMMFLAAFAFLLHPLVSTASRGAMAVSICAIGMLIYGSDVLMATTAVLDAVPPAQAGRASAYVNGIGSVGQMLCIRLSNAPFVQLRSVLNLSDERSRNSTEAAESGRSGEAGWGV